MANSKRQLFIKRRHFWAERSDPCAGFCIGRPANTEPAVAFEGPIPVKSRERRHINGDAQGSVRDWPVNRFAAPCVTAVKRSCDAAARVEIKPVGNLSPGQSDNIRAGWSDHVGKLVGEERKTLIDVHLPSKPDRTPARLEHKVRFFFRGRGAF